MSYIIAASQYIRENNNSICMNQQGTMVMSTGASPSFVEFDSYVKYRGDFDIFLDYATSGPLFLSVSLNDICVAPNVVLNPTEGFVKSAVVAKFKTTQDERRIRIRFEPIGGVWLPQIASIRIEPSTTSTVPSAEPPPYSQQQQPLYSSGFPPGSSLYPQTPQSYPGIGYTPPVQQQQQQQQPAPVQQQQQQPAPVEEKVTTIKATKFTRGTACKNDTGYGDVITSNGVAKATAEYDLSLIKGLYSLEIRFASGERRGVKISLNGAVIQKNAIDFTTGGFFLSNLYTHKVAEVNWPGGVLSIKIEPEGSYLPHIHELIITKVQ